MRSTSPADAAGLTAGEVIFEDGVRGRLEAGSIPTGPGVKAVRLADGRQVWVGVSMLKETSAGAYTVALAARDLADRIDKVGEHFVVLPVAQEQVSVEKREIETGRVVINVSPRTRTEHVDVELSQERASVERVPVNRFVTKTEQPRQEGDVTIIPVYEEVLVVERRLVLKEEVRVRMVRETRREARDVELREEVVEVTRDGARGAAADQESSR
jgi:stress response protein YsnF